MSLKTEDDLPEELVITLRKPVEHLKEEYTELRLREPTAGEMQMIRAKPMTDQQTFGVSLISGVPEGAVKKMGVRDVTRAEAYLVSFIEAAQRTGGE